MVGEMQRQAPLRAVQRASDEWKAAFNSGSADGCASHYEVDAVMTSNPFGVYHGRDEIQRFWQKLIDDGLSDVEYADPKVEIIDERSAVLRSRWKMNKAQGVITSELWILQDDGTAKLRIDEFEARD